MKKLKSYMIVGGACRNGTYSECFDLATIVNNGVEEKRYFKGEISKSDALKILRSEGVTNTEEFR